MGYFRLRSKKGADPAQSETPFSLSVRAPRHPNRWQTRFFRWIDKRTPVTSDVTLFRKNLYIFPTVTGLSFLALGFVLWLLGTSYQNNLVLALSYLLFSIIIVAIFHTYANLAGLHLKVLGAKPAFAGETAYFILQVHTQQKKGYHNLLIRWWDGEPGCFDFTKDQMTEIQVGVYADKRGLLKPGKLLIESVYPLGIIRCWTWLNLEAGAVIFPKPLKVALPVQIKGEDTSEQGVLSAGGDDFIGLKEYRVGDPVKHIAWKHYAREQGLYSKEYGSGQTRDRWLNWHDFTDLQPEARLSALCYWVLRSERLQIAYGLRLPGKQLPPALGDGHRLNVLNALAFFDLNATGY